MSLNRELYFTQTVELGSLGVSHPIPLILRDPVRISHETNTPVPEENRKTC